MAKYFSIAGVSLIALTLLTSSAFPSVNGFTPTIWHLVLGYTMTLAGAAFLYWIARGVLKFLLDIDIKIVDIERFEPEEKRRFFFLSGLCLGGLVSAGSMEMIVDSTFMFVLGISVFSIVAAGLFTLLVVAKTKYKDSEFWRQYGIGMAIYFGGVVVGIPAGIISFFAFFIVLMVAGALFLLWGMIMGGSSGSSGGGGSGGSDSGIIGKCSTCSRYQGGKCMDDPGSMASPNGSCGNWC